MSSCKNSCSTLGQLLTILCQASGQSRCVWPSSAQRLHLTSSHSLLRCPWAPHNAHSFTVQSPAKCLLEPHL
ncbi:hypothetical protein XELAEV_18001968mg [Xenopus laevis]|uniref:Secreted protein n=1 Tax=Xenopus laevis TaxID=8355 RepID=A0A974BNU4_XENLA|nr:hypothetical protein XELAEV_18001968mg [Xenopus laevis]